MPVVVRFRPAPVPQLIGSAFGAGLGTLTLAMVVTVQTTYILGQLPGTPVFYRQFADHLAWSSGNAG